MVAVVMGKRHRNYGFHHPILPTKEAEALSGKSPCRAVAGPGRSPTSSAPFQVLLSCPELRGNTSMCPPPLWQPPLHIYKDGQVAPPGPQAPVLAGLVACLSPHCSQPRLPGPCASSEHAWGAQSCPCLGCNYRKLKLPLTTSSSLEETETKGNYHPLEVETGNLCH